MEFVHKSIMIDKCLEGLVIKPDGIYVDGTLGGGGHSFEICKRLGKDGVLIGIDQDVSAMEAATTKLHEYSEKTMLVRGNFFDFESILSSLEVEAVDGILLDLGVSSYQFDEPSRGFSYMHDALLDMRMDKSKKFSAYDVINKYDEKELNRVIEEYGEERWAKRIASFIVNNRQYKPIKTTFELVTAIKQAIPKAAREEGGHPAKRTFQAIRIEVNNELAGLSKAIISMCDKLKPGGRICIITFHSLEDRIVKNTFRDLYDPCKCPIEFPQCVCGKKSTLKLITKKPEIASDDELLENPRSRSAKLRIAEKIESI